MKKTLLLLSFIFAVGGLYAQTGQFIVEEAESEVSTSFVVNKSAIKVYPNPAISYFDIHHAKGLKSVHLYNIIGKKVKSFDLSTGNRCSVEDIPQGMYLIQFIDYNDNVVTTRRLSKRLP